MSTLHDLEEQLPLLTPAEKAQLLQTVARDLGDAFQGLKANLACAAAMPALCEQGSPWGYLKNSGDKAQPMLRFCARIPVWAQDLANAWAYVRSHREEIERQIRENEEAMNCYDI